MRVLKRLLPWLVIAAMVQASAACGARRQSDPATPGEAEQTTLLVRNDNYLDHTIYLLSGSQRVRLGVARGLSTSRFVIPAQFVFGPVALQFLADPIGARVTPVSERVSVVPGDEVQIIIPAR
ncbi:MAG TPA: hypothetical protein VLE53_12580 [Gemmatimonadaceae bacterium]|nr:hypothetical protein [Gemmatimonadaceae bacterium]